MPRPDVLAVVLAGGQGSRLEALTDQRAKPAVPFVGGYRLIDFPLSNCLHSAISDVWVLQQYEPASLNDHLANGRPWDLDRTTGGLLVLPPYQGSEREGWTQGTADGLWRQAELIRQLAPRVVVLLSADAVYRLDYRDVIRAHDDSGATLTMVTTKVDAAEAARYGVVEVDGERVVGYEYKPEQPATDVVSNEVFVFRPEPVLGTLEELAEAADDDGLQDLGQELLPRLVVDGEVHQYRHADYWRDVGTVDAYWSANMDFLRDDPPLDLDDPAWPVRTNASGRSPAWVGDDATIRTSLIASATHIAGSVEHSVIGPGSTVEAGAHVVDSVLLPGVVVRSGARVVRAVVNDGVVIEQDAGADGSDDDITLVD